MPASCYDNLTFADISVEEKYIFRIAIVYLFFQS